MTQGTVAKRAEEINQYLLEAYESAPDRLERCNELEECAMQQNNREWLGLAWFHRGVYYNTTLENYTRFRDCMQQSIACLKDTKQYTILCTIYLFLGIDAVNYGQMNLGLDSFLMALHYAHLCDNAVPSAMVESYLAGFYLTINETEEALQHALSAMELLDEGHPSNSLFGSDGFDMASCMLGECYIRLGKFDKAWECYEQSVRRQQCYTPHYDCPNTALIYAFQVMALHVSSRIQECNQACEGYLDLLKHHPPAPPFFMHLASLNNFLLAIGEMEYAKRFLQFLMDANEIIKNPNFGVIIANMQIVIAKSTHDEAALSEALQEHYRTSIANSEYFFENMRKAVHLRTEMDQVMNEVSIVQAANEAKSLFLSNVSHEIRTPLNAILGMDEMILRETSEDEIYQYALDIKSAGNTLLSLINDILDFSKLEAGKLAIIPVEYDISSLINDLSNMIEPRATAKGLDFLVDVDPKVPFLLYGDEIRIKQCALNILTNAVKYTEHGAVELHISAKPVEGKADREQVRICFSIKDTGIGIHEEDIPKLFLPFERIDEERNRTIEGTGLGMSIVQRFLDLMDSKLVVESVYGKGSTFSFEIVQDVRSSEQLGDYTARLKRSPLRQEKRYQVSFVAPSARVLVIDDTKANLTVMQGLLKQTKMQVDTCDSGFKALELVQKQQYQVIFIDQRMPNMDGVETLHRMRALENNRSKEAVHVALTANAISGAREMFLEEGFDDYLSKPLDGQKLERSLMHWIPEAYVEAYEGEADAMAEAEPELESMQEIPGVSISDGLTACGGDGTILLATIKDFVDGAESQIEKIESFESSRDLANYTIEVHGLKSAARLIGAVSLSEAAAELEQAGNAKDTERIATKTGALLSEYRRIAMALGEHLPKENEQEVGKEPISNAQLQEIYGGILEFVSAYDFDSAANLCEMLHGYALSEEDATKLHTIERDLRAADHDHILTMLS